MADLKTIRINKVLRELNISLDRAVEHLSEKGFQVEARPTAKISQEEYNHLLDAFQTDRSKKEASHEVFEEKRKEKEAIREQTQNDIPEQPAKTDTVVRAQANLSGLKTVGKIDLTPKAPKQEEKPKPVTPAAVEPEPSKEKHPEQTAEAKTAPAETSSSEEKQVDAQKAEPKAPENSDGKIVTQYKKLTGLKATGQKIDLQQFKKPESKKSADGEANKRRRKRITKDTGAGNRKPAQNRGGHKQQRPAITKEEPTEEEIQKQIRETLEKLQGKTTKSKGAKYRR
jgi:translation initiation factor IF-2